MMFVSLLRHIGMPGERFCTPCKGSLPEYSVVSERAVLRRVISCETAFYPDGRHYPGADINDIVSENIR